MLWLLCLLSLCMWCIRSGGSPIEALQELPGRLLALQLLVYWPSCLLDVELLAWEVPDWAALDSWASARLRSLLLQRVSPSRSLFESDDEQLLQLLFFASLLSLLLWLLQLDWHLIHPCQVHLQVEIALLDILWQVLEVGRRFASMLCLLNLRVPPFTSPEVLHLNPLHLSEYRSN